MKKLPIPSRCRAESAPQGITRRDWALLLFAALLPPAALLVLHSLNVPLGKPGTFVYLYSPMVAERVAAVPAAAAIGLVLTVTVWLASSDVRIWRRLGLAGSALGVAAIAVWSYFAPPAYLRQHVFNMQSPSHDGAFLSEALVIGAGGQCESLKQYLKTFPERARTPPAEMRGTRVISNPPGTTLLTVALHRLWSAWAPFRWATDWALRNQNIDADFRERAALALLFAWALTALWLGSSVFLYLMGRLFLQRPAAAAFALCSLISPMTLPFTPGKDPAQLLTVALPLWLWFVAYRRVCGPDLRLIRCIWPALLAGGLFVFACMVSLVHVWIAAIVLVACFLEAGAEPEKARRLACRAFLPAMIGALAVAGALHAWCDWNVFGTAWAVVRSQAQVTRGATAMPLAWQALGIPLFLLFAGPAVWSVLLWLARGAGGRSADANEGATGSRRARPTARPGRALDQAERRLGLYLLIGSAIVMCLTIGFTNMEAPRLWIPFVPLLLLGAALRLPSFRRPTGHRALLLAALVFAQVAVSAVQWSLMDMREAETRLVTDGERRARFFY